MNISMAVRYRAVMISFDQHCAISLCHDILNAQSKDIAISQMLDMIVFDSKWCDGNEELWPNRLFLAGKEKPP